MSLFIFCLKSELNNKVALLLTIMVWKKCTMGPDRYMLISDHYPVTVHPDYTINPGDSDRQCNGNFNKECSGLNHQFYF